MIRKMGISLAAVLFGVMSLGYVAANQNDYSSVPQNPQTHAAYIDKVYEKNGSVYVVADFIDWYEGDEANAIFREREQDPEMTEAPDGYYIVNDETDLQTIELAGNAEVLMQIYNRTGNAEEAGTVWNEKIDVAKFVSLAKSKDEVLNVKDYPYHLEIVNNEIVKITQQFVP